MVNPGLRRTVCVSLSGPCPEFGDVFFACDGPWPRGVPFDLAQGRRGPRLAPWDTIPGLPRYPCAARCCPTGLALPRGDRLGKRLERSFRNRQRGAAPWKCCVR
jgi:hypothetical protein